MEDLHAWTPKLKKTGVITGHDYRGPVIKAVTDFCKKMSITHQVVKGGCWEIIR